MMMVVGGWRLVHACDECGVGRPIGRSVCWWWWEGGGRQAGGPPLVVSATIREHGHCANFFIFTFFLFSPRTPRAPLHFVLRSSALRHATRVGHGAASRRVVFGTGCPGGRGTHACARALTLVHLYVLARGGRPVCVCADESACSSCACRRARVRQVCAGQRPLSPLPPPPPSSHTTGKEISARRVCARARDRAAAAPAPCSAAPATRLP